MENIVNVWFDRPRENTRNGVGGRYKLIDQIRLSFYRAD